MIVRAETSSPKFLVVVPAYNAAEYLPETIDSLRAQTLANWLCIIVDDGSTDNMTPALADELAMSDQRISVIHQPNTGLPGARNAGWQAGDKSSEYLYFLDADDLAEPDALEYVAGYLDKHENVGCVYGRPYFWFPDEPSRNYLDEMLRFEQNGFRMNAVSSADAKVTLRTLAANPVIIPSVSFFRRSIFDKTGGWDASLNRMCEDIDMSLHIALYGEVHFVDKQLIKYRRHADNMSNDNARWQAGYDQMRAKWEAYVSEHPEQSAQLADALTFSDLYKCHKHFHGMTGSLRQKKLGDAFDYLGKLIMDGASYPINKRKRQSRLG